MSLESDIRELWRRYDDGLTAADAEASHRAVLEEFLAALETGDVRAAEKSAGEWVANEWVKQGILLNFGLRETDARAYGDVTYHDVLPLRETDDLGDEEFTIEGILIRDDATGYDHGKLDFDGDAAAAKDVKRLYVRDEATTAWSAW